MENLILSFISQTNFSDDNAGVNLAMQNAIFEDAQLISDYWQKMKYYNMAKSELCIKRLVLLTRAVNRSLNLQKENSDILYQQSVYEQSIN